ncbi:hypothetical protein [Nostoc sp.]|uniref:hypothetical protein n=1 Tax=Nostoc sp. TaxID=1180 RepID=UPI002FF4F31D
MKPSENNETHLAYEPPKLRKHGTIHEMTLTSSNSGGSGDGGSTLPNVYSNPSGS